MERIFVNVLFVAEIFDAITDDDVISVTLILDVVKFVVEIDVANMELDVIFVIDAFPDEIDVALTVPALTS